MLNIIIADDHPLTLIGTESFVKNLGHCVVETYSNGVACLNGILIKNPEVAIIDVNMPGLNGLEILTKLQMSKTTTKVILLTMHREMSIYLKSKSLGGKGYLLKDYAHLELQLCLDTIMRGDYFLSNYLEENLVIDTSSEGNNRSNCLTFVEKKVVELVAQQLSNKKVAELLFIAEKTVESHKRNIAAKLGLPKQKNALLIWCMQEFRNK